MVSTGVSLARSKLVYCAYDVSLRPYPVPICDFWSAIAFAESLASGDAAGAADPAAEARSDSWRSGWSRRSSLPPNCGCMTTGGRGRSRNTATPITPTLSGRPVRVAYELASVVKKNAAVRERLVRQPAISEVE